MKLIQQFLTKNSCYVNGSKIKPKGIMVHSTGANNPNLYRYVPGNDDIGYNKYNNHWNVAGLDKCPHAFIGKLANGNIGTVQTLPWDRRGWHCGKGNKGSANDTHISFEICEDNLTNKDYFTAIYNEAVELTAYLCNQYNLDPLGNNVIICHSEGYKLGIASNHADVLHWWSKYGKTMNDFRQDVKKAMNPIKQEYRLYIVKSGDSWWKIAQNEMGDGTRYKELQAFNSNIGLTLHPDDIIKIPLDSNIDLTNVSEYAKIAWTKAVKKGIVDGTNPKGNVTREMLTVILDALNQLD